MTVAEKRKAIELLSKLIRYDVLSDEEVREIVLICEGAVNREIRRQEGEHG